MTSTSPSLINVAVTTYEKSKNIIVAISLSEKRDMLHLAKAKIGYWQKLRESARGSKS